MNYFSTQRFTTWSILILILLNLFTITALWFFRFRESSQPPSQQVPPGNVEDFLQEELGLADEQALKFEELRQQHFTQSKVLVDENQQLKRELIEEVFSSSPDAEKMEALAEEIGAKQAELEKLRYNHFLELKSICQPEQLKKFQALFHEIFPPVNASEAGRPPQAGPPGSQGQRPPQEAFVACQGKNQEDTCQFTSPHGTRAGTCKIIGDQLACVPRNGQSGNPPGGQPDRPAMAPPRGQNP